MHSDYFHYLFAAVTSGIGSLPNAPQTPLMNSQQPGQYLQPIESHVQVQMANNTMSAGHSAGVLMDGSLLSPTSTQMPYPRAHLVQTTTAGSSALTSAASLVEVRPAAQEPIGLAGRSKRQAGIPPECCTADPCDPCGTTPCIACPVC